MSDRKYRKFLRTMMGYRSSSTVVENVFALLVESGLIYLCFWVSTWVRPDRVVGCHWPTFMTNF